MIILTLWLLATLTALFFIVAFIVYCYNHDRLAKMAVEASLKHGK